MQGFERLALFRQHHAPGGITIEPVHQLQKLCVRSQLAQCLNQAETDPATAVNRQTRWFIDNQEAIVFKQDGILQGIGQRVRDKSRRLLRRITDPHRRNPHNIPHPELELGLDPGLVNPDLALAQQAVNARFRHTFQHFEQVVVDTLPFGTLVHGH